MRILYWSELFWPYIGGVETLSAAMLPALAAHGHVITVVTSHNDLDLPETESFNGITVNRFDFRGALRRHDIEEIVCVRSQVVNVITAAGPDVIHLDGIGSSAMFLLQTRRKIRAPLLVTLHSDLLRGRKNNDAPLHTSVLRVADWVTTVSRSALRQAESVVPDIAEKSSVAYSGIRIPALAPAALPYHPAVILCLGRLVPEKGFDLAIAAFAEIVTHRPDTRLVIAGGGPESDRLRAQSRDLGIADCVEFPGVIAPDQVPGLINTATIVAMPSRHEGMPVVAMEAAAMARPIVATNVSGLPEIVTDTVTGLVVTTGDVTGLCDALLYLLDNPDTATAMGAAGRAHVVTDFTIENGIDSREKLYTVLTRGNTP